VYILSCIIYQLTTQHSNICIDIDLSAKHTPICHRWKSFDSPTADVSKFAADAATRTHAAISCLANEDHFTRGTRDVERLV